MVSKINNNKTIAMGFLIIMSLGGMAMAHTSIPIKDVEVLTLQAGKMTTGRRASPVLQQECNGPIYLCKNRPESIQCWNTGWDGLDANWECKGELENGVKFGKMNVQCEGYEYREDPNILAGSCGLEYTLDTTSDYIRTDYRRTRYEGGDEGGDEGGVFLGFLVMMFIFFGFISCLCDTGDTSNHGRYSNRSSSNDFWSGAAVGYSVGRSSGGDWSSWGSDRSSGWGGSSMISGFAITSRR